MALTLVPTGWCCTKSRNGISSFTTSPDGVGDGDDADAAALAVTGRCRSAGRRRGRHRHRGGRLLARPTCRTHACRLDSWSVWADPPSAAALRPDGGFDARTALRLIGPRTGLRATQTHPTCGTGLPPTRRPSSNNQSCSPWNSWNESFERIVALAFLAMLRTNASPRPIAPAGGATSSLLAIAASNSLTSDGAIRCPNVASTTTVTRHAGMVGDVRVDGLVQLGEARHRSTFGRDVRAVDHDVLAVCGLGRHSTRNRRVVRRDQRSVLRLRRA